MFHLCLSVGKCLIHIVLVSNTACYLVRIVRASKLVPFSSTLKLIFPILPWVFHVILTNLATMLFLLFAHKLFLHLVLLCNLLPKFFLWNHRVFFKHAICRVFYCSALSLLNPFYGNYYASLNINNSNLIFNSLSVYIYLLSFLTLTF